MLKIRLVVCLLLKNGQIVKSMGFERYQFVGSPKIAIDFFNAWSADEIIFLDIGTEEEFSPTNGDRLDVLSRIVKESSTKCFVPLTVGGGIKNINQMSQLFSSGADKITINTEALRNPELIKEASTRFGNQAIVVSIDAKSKTGGGYEVFIDHGKEPTGKDPASWAREAESYGAGEILINSIDRDGSLRGYDVNLISEVVKAVNVPVIALGGVARWEHLLEGINAGASAVAAANIFHFTEQSTRSAKKWMEELGINIR